MAIDLILYPLAKVVRVNEVRSDSLSFVLAAAGVRIQGRTPQSSYTSIFFYQDDLALVESLLLALDESDQNGRDQ